MRDAFDSLSLTAQFRVAAVAAVIVTLLAVQVVSAIWDARVARHEALDLAETKVASMARRLEGTGGGALDNLEGHPEVMVSTFRLQTGELLQRYLRTDLDVETGPEALRWSTRPTGAGHWIKRYLALEPIYVERSITEKTLIAGI